MATATKTKRQRKARAPLPAFTATATLERVTEECYVGLVGEGGFAAVAARPVAVPGAEGFDLFVHRSIDCAAIPGMWDYAAEGWTVSDGVTGRAIIDRARTPEDAVAQAAALAPRLPEGIVQALNLTGLSPRYAVRYTGIGRRK